MRPAREIWEAALGELQLQVTPANFHTWLKNTTGLAYRDGEFVVGVPSAFVSSCLEQRLNPLIQRTLARVTGKSLEAKFQVCPQRGQQPLREVPASSNPSPGNSRLQAQLNPHYTFASFIVGNCNEIAHAAALSIAKQPGVGYNPLFLYGGVGLGKTHLLHAIGHVVRQSSRYLICVTAEQFTNDFVNAIRDQKTESFRSKYRNADVLLIDDIHVLQGKDQTQECLFHTFNDLHNAGRQIVLSSDRPPKALALLEDRLRSRFEWGLIVDIQPPDLETRLAILQAKAQEQGSQVPNEVLQYIARRLPDNIRALEGSLNRVTAYARLTRSPLTVELATEALAEITSSDWQRTMSPTLVLGAVATHFNLDVAILQSKRRDKEVALARQIAMFLLREETHASWNSIGRELGGRDHSTVLHGYNKISTLMNTDTALRRTILDIRHQLHSSNTTT